MPELVLDAIPGLLDAAGRLALRWFRAATLAAEDKGGARGYDPVTEADRAVETYLRKELTARFPGHAVTGEEQGTTGPERARHRWLIDPIDGTKAFVSGVPAWGVLAGLLADGVPVAGWMRQPYLRETFGAAGGAAVFHGPDGDARPLRTRRTTDLAEAVMYTTHPGMFLTDEERAAFGRLARAVRLQRFGGDCYSYCLLAMGQIDLVVEADLRPYDIVPLIPIVEGAGGVVTGRGGRPATEGGFVVAAATPDLHARALDVL